MLVTLKHTISRIGVKMARQRMVKPEFIESESLAKVSHSARLTFVILLMVSDDDGRFKVNKILKTKAFPLDDSFSDDDFEDVLWELESIGSIRFYLVENVIYGDIPNFSKYQTINRKSKTFIPEFESNLQVKRVLNEYSLISHGVASECNTHGVLSEHSPVKKERRKEGTISSFLLRVKGSDEPVENSSDSPISLFEFKEKNPSVRIPSNIKEFMQG